MNNLYGTIITADTNGTPARVNGVACLTPATVDTAGVATTRQFTDYYLTGATYSVEDDSTGEVYVQFMDRSFTALTDVILLHRGVIVHVPASLIRVVGVRRAGKLRVTTGDAGFGVRVNNPASDIVVSFGMRFPAGVNGTTGPGGWVAAGNDATTIGGNYMVYNGFEPLGVGGDIVDVVATDIGTVNPANYFYLAVGFAGYSATGEYNTVEVARIVNNGTMSTSPVPVTPIAPYTYPAIFWMLSPAGVIANVGTPRITLKTRIKNMYQRRPGGTTALDFT